MKEKTLFKYKGSVLEAGLLGFFRRVDPKGLCKHSTCGHVTTNKLVFGKYKRIVGPKVRCRRIKYIRYTDKELASPDSKPNAVAVRLVVADATYKHELNPSMRALYDLAEDKWANSDWWQSVGSNKDMLVPHAGVGPASRKPGELANIDEVIRKIKELI